MYKRQVVCVVYEFRGIPMMAPDILTVQTATSVMGNYTFKLTFEQYSVILVCMAFFFTFLRLHEVKVTEKRVFHIAGFIVVALGCGLFTNQIILSDFMEEHLSLIHILFQNIISCFYSMG